ncbi:MAG TPA: MFS transporter [Turneriella sp.]|nr:MFS transporter [Turneriella sp.]
MTEGSFEVIPMLIFFYLNTFLTLLIGNMFTYAMIIYSRAVTGSDAVTGLVYAGNLVPPLILGMYAGTVIDRFDRKRVVMIAQTTFIYTGGAMVFLTAQQVFAVSDFLLIAVMLVNGIGLSFIIPGRMALLGDLFDQQHIPRESMKIHIMIMVGFGLAPFVVGYLRQHFDWYVVFATIGILYGVAMLFLFPLQTRPHKRKHEGESAWHSLVAGLRYVRREPLILSLLAATFMGLFLVGPLQVLLPEFSKTQMGLNESQRGSLMTILGVGLLIGGGLAQFLAHRMRRGLMIVLGAVASGTSMLLIPWLASPAPVALSLALSGIFGGLMGTLIPAAIQQATVEAARGRVMSIYNIVFQGSVAVAAIGLSRLSKFTSPAFAFEVGGWFIIVGALSCLWLKPLRTLR